MIERQTFKSNTSTLRGQTSSKADPPHRAVEMHVHDLCPPALVITNDLHPLLPSPCSCPHKQGRAHVDSGCLPCMQLQQIPHKVSICMHAAAFQSPAQRLTSRRSSLPSSRKQIRNHALRCTTATLLNHHCTQNNTKWSPGSLLEIQGLSCAMCYLSIFQFWAWGASLTLPPS